jgi:AraC-like DNA-binding protein
MKHLFLYLFCIVFSQLCGQNSTLGDSIFQNATLPYYKKNGIDRVNYLDSIYSIVSTNNPERTKGLLIEVLSIIEKAGLSADEKIKRLAKLNLKLGDILKSQYKYPESLKHYEQAAFFAEKLDSITKKINPELAFAYTSMGRLTASALKSTENFDKAFEYFNKAAPIYQTCRDTAGLIFNYDMMCGTAFEFLKGDIAIKNAFIGLELAKRFNKNKIPTFLRRLGDGFLLKEQADSTIYYLDKIGTYYDTPDRLVRKTSILMTYGEAYFMKKDWKKVIEKCVAFENIGKKVNIPVGTYAPMYYLYADACYQSGNYKAAYEHMERFKILEDSITTIANDDAVAEMREKYETTKKNQEIALLTSENQAKTFRNWFLVSLLALGSLASYLAFSFLKEKRKQRESELMNENSILQGRLDRLLILHLDEKIELTGNVEDDFIPNLFNLFEKNLANEQFSIEILPKEMGISRAQFFKKVKDITGKSPAELLRELRMQKAKKLLQANHTTVAEVAYATGFNSSDAFSRAFKTFFGESPSIVKKGSPEV